ncbi:MAG: hypothetical protein MUE33_10185 [Cytophagaceae bacterium]|jgi:hypothetical protein|nr:hypothetical protein [Cytophagaceae bacterium]
MTFFRSTTFLIIASIILIGELVYATVQYSRTKVDGDFAAIVLPAPWYAQVLEDPIGTSALLEKERYGGTNRFTAHVIMRTYFYHVPIVLQQVVSPIESVYLSITLAKLGIHILFLSLIGFYAASFIGLTFRHWLLALLFVSPFLIAHGPFIDFYSFLDKTITYAMFYTLPMCGILLYYAPIFYQVFIKKSTVHPVYLMLYIPISFFMVSFGPLAAPLILLINGLIGGLVLYTFLTATSPLASFTRWIQEQGILFVLLFVGVLFSIYSMYLGTFNIENESCTIPIIDRYISLMKGIYYSLFSFRHGGVFLLGLGIWGGTIVGKPFIQKEYRLLLLFVSFLLIGYTVLLPFGGCRIYRPFILRRDTFLPILTLLLFLTSVSALHIFHQENRKRFYLFFLPWLALSVFFWKMERMPESYDDNTLEKKNLYQLQRSTEDCTTLNEAMSIFSWNNYSDCGESYINSALLVHYNIIDRYRLYKNKE